MPFPRQAAALQRQGASCGLEARLFTRGARVRRCAALCRMCCKKLAFQKPPGWWHVHSGGRVLHSMHASVRHWSIVQRAESLELKHDVVSERCV